MKIKKDWFHVLVIELWTFIAFITWTYALFQLTSIFPFLDSDKVLKTIC